MYGPQHRVLSQPAEVWWAGFRSDTFQLQQAGWEIAAHEEVAYNRISLVLRHQNMKLYAMTHAADYYYRRDQYDLYSRGGPGPLLRFEVSHVAPQINIRTIPSIGLQWDKFKQIDAQPQYVESEIKSLDDFKIFATPLTRTEELIVEPQTVAALLEQIRTMQAPEQQRIRQDARSRDARDTQPRQTFHAQIISLADHRLAA